MTDRGNEHSHALRKTYLVVAERSGDYWAIYSPDVQGALSQCAEEPEIELNAKQAIARVLDCDVENFDVNVRIEPF